MKIVTSSVLAFGVVAGGHASADNPQSTYDQPAAAPRDEVPAPATEEAQVPDDFGYAWHDPRLKSDIGVGFTVGGGVAGFTDQSMRNALSSSISGLWQARASIGTHIPVGLDVSYIGLAGNMNTLTGASNGTLVGTTVEGALRYNILPHYAWNPYVFAGVGWQRFDVTSPKFTTSDSGVKKNENLAEYPMGAGLSYRDHSGVTVDVRGTFRAAPSSTLVLDSRSGAYASAHSWDAGANIGYEF